MFCIFEQDCTPPANILTPYCTKFYMVLISVASEQQHIRGRSNICAVQVLSSYSWICLQCGCLEVLLLEVYRKIWTLSSVVVHNGDGNVNCRDKVKDNNLKHIAERSDIWDVSQFLWESSFQTNFKSNEDSVLKS